MKTIEFDGIVQLEMPKLEDFERIYDAIEEATQREDAILEGVIDVPVDDDDYAALEGNDIALRGQQPKIIVIAANTARDFLR